MPSGTAVPMQATAGAARRRPDIGRDQINRRLAGCDVGRCHDTGGGNSTHGAWLVSRVTIDAIPITGAGIDAGMGGTRPTSLLWSFWLQWAMQMADSSAGFWRWQSRSIAIGAMASVDAMATIAVAG